MFFISNAFEVVNNSRRRLFDAKTIEQKRERAKLSGKKRVAPGSFALRLESLEERALLSVVPPFADDFVDQGASPAADSPAASLPISIPDLSESVSESATLVVSTFDDVLDSADGVLSLREAIALARDGDTITFSAPGVVNLSVRQLEITKAITIDAMSVWDSENDAPGVVVDAGSKFRALVVSGQDVSLSGLSFANGYGCVVEAEAGSSVSFSNCEISGGRGSYNGGGIYAREAAITIENSAISGNTALNCGGGIYAERGSITIANSVISGNKAASVQSDGGGFFALESATTISNSAISGNSAHSGGGFCASGGSTTIANSSISGNRADYNGGGVCVYDGALTVSGGSISCNTANRGGGVYIIDHGSGDSICDDDDGSLAVANGSSVFDGALGGVPRRALTVENSVIVGNVASSGGGVYAYDGAIKVANVTVSGNVASDEGGGFCLFGNQSSEFYNAIVSLNLGGNLSSSPAPLIMNSLIGADPGFIVPPVFSEEGLANLDDLDLRLTRKSLAIDCGCNDYCDWQYDLDNQTRIVGSLSSTGIVDIGAYEYQETIVGSAETYSGIVTTIEDSCDATDGKISLREALLYANVGDAISFAPDLNGATIELSGSELCATKEVRLDASALSDGITIDAGGKSGVFSVYDDCSFNGIAIVNGAALRGGGIYVNGADATVSNCLVSGNAAVGDGGGIYASGGAITILNSAISDNAASGNGGGIYASGGAITIADCSVFDNVASSEFDHNNQYGGGIYASGRETTIANCSISGNTVNGDGGGVYADGGAATIAACVVSGNAASQAGGGIYAVDGSVTIAEIAVSGNKACFGGGIYATASTSTVESCSISGNKSTGVGAGVYAREGEITFVNNLISGNTTEANGGAVFAAEVAAAFTNCTIVGNAAYLHGGGVCVSYRGRTTFYNTILTSNFNGDLFENGNGSSVAGHGVLITDASTITGDQDDIYEYNPELPLFVGAEKGDYRLTENSQAIDLGSDEYARAAGMNEDSKDLAGKRRIVGGSIDLGAYEYDAFNPAAPVNLTIGDFEPTTRSVSVSWTLESSDATGFLVQYSVDGSNWIDVATSAEATSVSLVGLDLGTSYTVRVAATNAVGVSEFVSVEFTTPDVPAAPVNLTIGDFEPTTRSVSVSWTLESSDATGFLVQYSVDGSNWIDVETSAEATSVSLVGLDLGTSYTVRAAAANGVGVSEFVVGTFTTPDAVASPAAPAALRLTVVNEQTGSFVASWIDAADNESGYLIEASIDGGSTWTSIARTDADATGATISGLGLDRSFALRVSAFNDAGSSDYVRAQVWRLGDFDSYQAFALTSPDEETVVLNGVNQDGFHTELETRALDEDFYVCVLGGELAPKDVTIASDALSRLVRIDFVGSARGDAITVDGTDEGDSFILDSIIVETYEQIFTENPYEKILARYASQYGEDSPTYQRLKSQYDAAYAKLAEVVKTTKTTWGSISLEGGANVRFVGIRTATANGGAGDDHFMIRSTRASYVVSGGDGFDMLNFLEASHGINVDLGATNEPQAAIIGDGGRLTLTDEFEMIYGSTFADRIVGSPNGSTIIGHGGADSITLAGGVNSVALNGSGQSVVARGSGTYAIALSDADYSTVNASGADENSSVTLDVMDSDRFTFFGGASALEARVSGAYATINAVDARQATIEIFGDHASATTGRGDDYARITGDYAVANVGAGDDCVEIVGANAGVLLGIGDDSAYLSDGTGGLAGGSLVCADEGNDFVFSTNASGSNTIAAGTGNDVVFGTSGNDVIYGVAGINALFGFGGADRIFGGSGRDLIFASQPAKLEDVDKASREELDRLYASLYESWVVENDLEATLDLIGTQCESDGETDNLFSQSVDQVFASELDGDIVNGKIWNSQNLD